MNWQKLAAIALGLASGAAGMTLFRDVEGVRETLLGAGTLLIGWAFPELFPKKEGDK